MPDPSERLLSDTPSEEPSAEAVDGIPGPGQLPGSAETDDGAETEGPAARAHRHYWHKRLAVALHNVRSKQLGETDADELEAVKSVSGIDDTQELRLPRTTSDPKSRGQRQREQGILDAARKFGNRS